MARHDGVLGSSLRCPSSGQPWTRPKDSLGKTIALPVPGGPAEEEREGRRRHLQTHLGQLCHGRMRVLSAILAGEAFIESQDPAVVVAAGFRAIVLGRDMPIEHVALVVRAIDELNRVGGPTGQ